MAPKSKAMDAEKTAEALLQPRPVRAMEFVEAIHAVNPTGLGLPGAIERQRYALKSRLQSRLILDFFEDVGFESVAAEPGVLGLRYRPLDTDACHAVLAELSQEARSRVQFHLDTSEASAALAQASGPLSKSMPAQQAKLVLDAAEVLFERREWQQSLAALGVLAEGDLPARARRHHHHLRAQALFELGRLPKARELVGLLQSEESESCRCEGWTWWLDALMGKTSGRAGQVVQRLRDADAALAAGEHQRAFEVLDVSLVWGCLEAQLGARLASAVLGRTGVGPVRGRMVLAAFLSRLASPVGRSLPLGVMSWTEERLAEAAERARERLASSDRSGSPCRVQGERP